MKKLILIVLFNVITTQINYSQTIDCNSAVTQLQTYANQVNQLYHTEYWTNIPIRCPAFNQWGQAFNPIVVQNCRNQMLVYLNTWYAQQCVYVNNAYGQIVNSCLSRNEQNIDPDEKPAPKRVSPSDAENKEIDTERIKELTAGVDENKSVVIRIPKTVASYNPTKQ